MINNSTIITFANQKGGVGKSALCSLFGCYLVEEKGVSVRVIDGDLQATLISRRKVCQGGGIILPEKYFALSQIDMTKERGFKDDFIGLVNNSNEHYILVDTPGSLQPAGLVDLLLHSDYIIVPFNQQQPVMDSTFMFVAYYGRVCRLAQERKLSVGQLIFVPNMIKQTWGTEKEKEAWDVAVNYIHGHYGSVTSAIGDYKTISLWNTFSLYPAQKEKTLNCFDMIWGYITGVFPPRAEEGGDDE